ncbi:hypothetical protein HaLaN_16597 [Haematococcus lacustris]|uniref:Uncharacterized protein n=1 Tax=Haematococcus lacustris TaxID=44745 RepID=A0A699ZCX5_HAELA|nr:hypothetical protein HaLaN_16597 [Haematococcus lacustris]
MAVDQKAFAHILDMADSS